MGTVLFLSVTIASAFSQPLPEPGPAQSGDGIFSAMEAVEPADNTLGHSFYPDLLLRATTRPSVLIVVERTDPRPALAQLLADIPESAALLVTAPRNDSFVPARVATALPELPADIPRVFLSLGEIDEWRLSVPGAMAPVWLARTIAETNPLPISLAQLNAAHLGFGRRDGNLDMALARGYAAARLETRDQDTARAALDALVAALQTLPPASIRSQERNYLIVPSDGVVLGGPVVLSEQVLVWSIVVTFVLLLLYAVNRPKRVQRYLRAIRHNLAPILGIFLVLVFSLMTGNLALRALAGIERLNPHPLLLAAGKFSIGFILLGLLYPLLHIRLRRASAVYSGASLALLLMGAFVSGAVSLIFGTFFVATFVLGFLFSLARPAWLKALALAAALSPVVYLLIALAAVADTSMAEALLRPPFWRELVTAVLLLPLLLMFFRLEALTPRVPLLVVLVMVSTIGLALVAATIISELQQARTIPVVIRETYPDSAAVAPSGAPDTGEVTMIGANGESAPVAVVLTAAGQAIAQCDNLPCTRQIVAPAPPATLSGAVSTALDRYTLDWAVAFSEPIDRFRLHIQTDVPVQLYASDLPSEQPLGSTGQQFTVVPGPFPPERWRSTVVLRRSEEDLGRITLRITTDRNDRGGRDVESSGQQAVELAERQVSWVLYRRIILE